jgi:cysteine desulfurase family protein (TIGR01976 family)
LQSTFDVERVRTEFPALAREHAGRRVTYLDGPGGSQVCRPAIDAMTRYMERGGANLHGAFPTSIETEELLDEARRAAADLLGARPAEIAFGANMTTLTLAVSRALAKTWDADSSVVVTELDHRANVDPWLHAAWERGAEERWIEVDPATLTLDLGTLKEKIDDSTKLVAVGLASNGVGTVTDVRRIADRAHEVGALVAVDAVHAVPHIPVDRDELGADIITCSAYKFFGPHVGVTAIRREVFEALEVHRLDPAPDHIPDKLETGTQNHEGIAGVLGAVDFVASLGTGSSRRERILDAMREIESYEEDLAEVLRSALRAMPGITLYAAPDDIRKTPTVSFRLDGLAPRKVCERVLEDGFFVANGDFYASTLAERLSIRDRGGWVRVGLAPYNTWEEAGRFLRSLEKLV